ncbi:DNA packaging protein [Enterobacter cloacae]|uniref:terminase small subunit-like protein n=1 Tax=Enterobacter cloacae TaxID=550 RepID=UPI001E472B58|nr:DNA packaging protein [Enterobacter cloacae]MCE1972933.1 DNA packaging protein [Enterobacter cloacae]
MSDETKQNGRPSEYSQEVANSICERIAAGESVRRICKSEHMPAQSTIYKWLNDIDGFSEQYARARELQAEILAEEIIEIADDSSGDIVTGEDGETRINSEFVARSRLRVDARKWYASKVAPKKYGDRIQQDINANINVSLIDRVLEARKRARGEDGGGTS